MNIVPGLPVVGVVLPLARLLLEPLVAQPQDVPEGEGSGQDQVLEGGAVVDVDLEARLPELGAVRLWSDGNGIIDPIRWDGIIDGI